MIWIDTFEAYSDRLDVIFSSLYYFLHSNTDKDFFARIFWPISSFMSKSSDPY